MADTILNSAGTISAVTSAQTFVFSGGTLGFLADGGTYATDLKLWPLTKVELSPKVEIGKKTAISATTGLKVDVRTWVKSISNSVKVTGSAVRIAFIETLLTSGYYHGKVKIWAKDRSDSTTRGLIIGENTATITIDGSLPFDEESPDVTLNIEIEGDLVADYDATIT